MEQFWSKVFFSGESERDREWEMGGTSISRACQWRKWKLQCQAKATTLSTSKFFLLFSSHPPGKAKGPRKVVLREKLAALPSSSSPSLSSFDFFSYFSPTTISSSSFSFLEDISPFLRLSPLSFLLGLWIGTCETTWRSNWILGISRESFFRFGKREGLSRKNYNMDSFNQGTGFRYNLNSNNSDDANDDSEFSGILEIFVHHARNIHNICIYDNQDVYAKFSLTYNPDETLSTSIVNGGGKNPEFNENLRMTITQLDANLKCEIWMLSRARNFMEDQLLGFALVPISKIAGKGKVTENYNLSSTDLTHSPAGTIQLSISLNTSLPVIPSKSISESSGISSISSEVVLLDRKISEVFLDPVEYSRIEFPDLSVVRENQKMVSQYFNLAEPSLASFLHLGAFYEPIDDYEMAANSSEELQIGSISTNGSLNSGIFSSNTTGLSDDRNSAESIENKHLAEIPNSVNTSILTEADYHGLDSATSRKGREAIDEKEGSSKFSSKEEETNKGVNPGPVSFSQVFSAPLGNINLEAEQSAMQQQIVDMYMRSMQQFTESLAKMKLPMDLDKPEHENSSVLVQNQREKPKNDKKNDGSRVFYGSRAFF